MGKETREARAHLFWPARIRAGGGHRRKDYGSWASYSAGPAPLDPAGTKES